jgi:methylmalonyl-CoA/ethylmalonyl-CoA epimerase
MIDVASGLDIILNKMNTPLAEQIFGAAIRPLHLGISVSNLEESVKWYTEMLGFEPSKRLDLNGGAVRIAIVEYQGLGIELIEVTDSATYPLAWQGPGGQHRTQGIVHFAFLVDDLDATADVLKAKSAKFACDLTTLEGLGIRYFHIFDNEGNLIEFGQKI